MKTLFLSTLVATTIATVTLGAASLPSIPAKYRTGGFAIGCQAYTFNRFTAFEAIEKTELAGGTSSSSSRARGSVRRTPT